MFLHNNRRIEARISVIALALLVFCLVEREIRNALAGDGKLDGFYAGRPARPTANLIFTALARLRLVPAIGDEPAGVPRPPPLQAHILDLLKIDPTRPR